LPEHPLPPADSGSTAENASATHSSEDEFSRTIGDNAGDRSSGIGEAADSPIGPYHLIQKIGEGGMGEVWLAEQTHPVRRRVALKLIKAGFNTREVVARFESERQALALMDHPAIAKIFDAGSTPEALPYFAMEYVAGLPITDYCDKHRLAVRERLALFVHVCEGVQHAHQKAVIHRDLKPSNILITEVDGKPMPKIIDFGIAKATAQRLTEQTMFTRVGALMGTPEYMSPEQADSGGEDIDTRTDVYSLGVIFYELLTGSLPLSVTQMRTFTFHELLRRLREDEAPRPSTKLRTLGDQTLSAARSRQTEPGTLRKQLRGDLDSIALKALEKNRTRRYGSPAEFAADIHRYLDDEPVLATASSALYRARKFVRRHRFGVAASSAVGLAVLALAITMTVQSARIARERDRANREAEAAKRVADFLVGLFQVSDPDESRGNTVTAREILDKGAREINTNLAGQPEMQARMMSTIGRVYEGLGLFQPAVELLTKAVVTQQRTLGPEHPDTLNSQRLLARLKQYQGHYPEAEKLLKATFERQQRVLGREHSDTLVTATTLGGLYSQQGRYAEAEKLLSKVLEISRRKLGPEHPDTLSVIHSLAIAYDGMHLYRKEEATWRELAEARRRVLGHDHPDTLAAINNLAYTEYRESKYADAEKLQRETLAISRRVQGNEHPNVLMALGNLANTLAKENRLDEAERLQREALDGRMRVLGPDNPDTLFSMNNLAQVLASEGKYKEAKNLYLQALAGERRVLGENHPELAGLWYNLAELEATQGHRTEALEYLRASIKCGYADPQELSVDDSFKSLRDDPEYKALLAEVHRRATNQK
jgi:non-specific serine/threonine protein kinase/serine/threonine-protein kinase